MFNFSDSAWLIGLAILFQLVGFVSVAVARFGEQSRRRRTGQALFFLSLVAVGVVTMLALAHTHDAWLPSGASLSLMAVGVTLDTRPSDADC